MIRIFVTLGIWLLLDLYAFHGLRTLTARWSTATAQIIHWTYWGVDLIILFIILYYSFSGKFSNGPGRQVGWVLGALMISLVPKLLVVCILGIEDIYRGLSALFAFSQKLMGYHTSDTYLPERRKVVSQLAFGLASIPFFGMLYGALKGKYDYRVHRVRLKFKDLPDAFDGFTITQLSDIHCGSFDDPDSVMRGVELANKQKSELLVFTGDFVNTKADELEEWFNHFKILEAPMGKFSILGNHDYGDYIPWPSQKEKDANLEKLKRLQKELDFSLLLNEHVRIEKDGQSIVLAGVENWGKRGFVKHGDLTKAIREVNSDDFTILLSHDPSHWEAVTLKEEKHIHLTLSGHTHGMQFGVEIPGFKWSPSKYLYPQWAGLYSQNDRHLYVNRGFGFLGFPGRVGILPEITVIELQKA
ncbi:MAG: metallophosphoesterase [Cryomorphaceae bacterium]|jgi:predicted MPP superfamily phosphohydrolase|nr:metallophosphoesterase [Cryomorphaceae bacterium]